MSGGEQNLFWPPLTGWVIAAVRWLFRTDRIAIIRLAWIALDLLCLLAMRTLAGRLGRTLFASDPARMRRMVLVATVGYALYLPAISYAQFTTSETVALLQILIVLVLLTGTRVRSVESLAAGALTGTLVLTRPSLLPLVIAWPVAIAWQQSTPTSRRNAVTVMFVGAAVIGGWALHNWRVAGRLTIADNSAHNFFIGNRDLYAEDLDLFSPVATREQIEFRRQQWSGDLASPTAPPAELRRQALLWITDHPLTFARRAIGRLARVFAPKTDVLELAGGERQSGVFAPVSLVLLSVANGQWTVVLFTGLIGLAAILRLAPDLGRLFVATIIGALLLPMVAIAKPRYSFVFDPILLLSFAAVLASPAGMRAAIGIGARRVLALIAAFLLWGWVAWLIFAFSSRLAM